MDITNLDAFITEAAQKWKQEEEQAQVRQQQANAAVQRAMALASHGRSLLGSQLVGQAQTTQPSAESTQLNPALAGFVRGTGLGGLVKGSDPALQRAVEKGGFGAQAAEFAGEMLLPLGLAAAATPFTGGLSAAAALATMFGAGATGAALKHYGQERAKGREDSLEAVGDAVLSGATEQALLQTGGAALKLAPKVGGWALKKTYQAAVPKGARTVIEEVLGKFGKKAAEGVAEKAGAKAAGGAAEQAGAKAAGQAAEGAAQRASEKPIEVIYEKATDAASKARNVTPESGDVLLKLPAGREIGKEGVEAAAVQYGKPVTKALLAAGVRPTPDPKLTLANIKLAKEEQRGVLEKLYGFLEQMPAGDAGKIADTVRKLFLDQLQKAPLSAAEKQAVKTQAEAAVKNLPHEYRQLREVAGQGFEWSKPFYGVTIGSLQRLRESLKRLDAKGPLKEVYDDVRRRLDAVIQHQLLKNPSEAASQFADRLFTEKARWRVLKSLEEAIADGNWQRAKELFSGEMGKAVEMLIQKGAANAEKMQASFNRAMRAQAKRAQTGAKPKSGAAGKASPPSEGEPLSSSVLNMASKLE